MKSNQIVATGQAINASNKALSMTIKIKSKAKSTSIIQNFTNIPIPMEK